MVLCCTNIDFLFPIALTLAHPGTGQTLEKISRSLSSRLHPRPLYSIYRVYNEYKGLDANIMNNVVIKRARARAAGGRSVGVTPNMGVCLGCVGIRKQARARGNKDFESSRQLESFKGRLESDSG